MLLSLGTQVQVVRVPSAPDPLLKGQREALLRALPGLNLLEPTDLSFWLDAPG